LAGMTNYATVSPHTRRPGSVEFGGESLSESPVIIVIDPSFRLTKQEKELV
jgi:hypothetical protein